MVTVKDLIDERLRSLRSILPKPQDPPLNRTVLSLMHVTILNCQQNIFSFSRNIELYTNVPMSDKFLSTQKEWMFETRKWKSFNRCIELGIVVFKELQKYIENLPLKAHGLFYLKTGMKIV